VLVKDYLMGKKTKPYSLMMSQAKLLKIPRIMVFFGSILEYISCLKKGVMVGPCFVVMANID
jgi:hypothetical protein